MKRAIQGLAISLLMLITGKCTAQYIAIPDSGFGNWLHSNGYAAAMTGNSINGYQLDTTDASVTSITDLDCSASDISDLSGIEYFTNLETLNCSQNQLLYVGTLPPLLRHLYCSDAFITAFTQPLPAGLETLDCERNALTTFNSLPNRLTEFYCKSNRISSLPDLPDSLHILHCDYNYLDSLPVLPPNLTELYCSNNINLIRLPLLPAALTDLDCSYDSLSIIQSLPVGLLRFSCMHNVLSSLPVLPTTLIELSCVSNRLTSLPSLPAALSTLMCSENTLSNGLPSLPASLTWLACTSDSLHSLPTLSARLMQLHCSSNQLTNLPALPAALQELLCDKNQLTTLPALPVALDMLYCPENLLTTIPALPQNLSRLTCDYNLLTFIPALPSSLTLLSCAHNMIGSLPPLPDRLTSLICNDNPTLSCLPRIPKDTMDQTSIGNTQIACLPNRFTSASSDVDLSSIPTCDPTSGCDFYYNIAGSINEYSGGSCAQDSLLPGTLLYNVKMQLQQGGNVIAQAYTSSLGDYTFKAIALGNYIVMPDTQNLPFGIVCPAISYREILLTAGDSVRKHENFSFSCTADLGVLNITPQRGFRPAFTSEVDISAGSIARLWYQARCNSITSCTVTTTFTGPVQFAGTRAGAMIPSSVAGHTLTYQIVNMDSLYSHNLDILLTTDSGAVSGVDEVCITTIISSFASDPDASNDTLTQCGNVANSWDPNHKEVNPQALSPDGGWLTYTIHFQNTGNDTAYLVVVRDTLSNNVQAESFQYLASSHRAVVQLKGKAMAFTFPKINLVDSATNSPLSEGWIQYRVKAKPNLPLQTQIPNTAYIYFDYNPAIVTNTAIATIDTVFVHAPSGIAPIAAGNMMYLYPNPNAGSFTLQTSRNIGSLYTITDVLGETIAQSTITTDGQNIDLHDAAPGVYTLYVKGARPVRFTVVR